jgi:hypothetical protein
MTVQGNNSTTYTDYEGGSKTLTDHTDRTCNSDGEGCSDITDCALVENSKICDIGGVCYTFPTGTKKYWVAGPPW